MPVLSSDLPQGAAIYADTLTALCGVPPAIDLVHLGLGNDGHCASLVPGDGSLDVNDRYVTPCGVYQGRQRMTLTYPVLDSGRDMAFLATGAGNAMWWRGTEPAIVPYRRHWFARSGVSTGLRIVLPHREEPDVPAR